MIRIGFIFSFDGGWLGGVNYFRNLLTAMHTLPDRSIEAVIFTGYDTPQDYFEGIPVEIIRSRVFDKKSLFYRIRHRLSHQLKRDFWVEWIFKFHRISALSHSDWLPGNADLPTIGWIPDFQHIHLPEFFSPEEIDARNQYYQRLCRFCSSVIVSSHDAQEDLRRFDPASISKSMVLQFVVEPPHADSNLPSHSELEKRYGYSGKFFLLPNQFWKHKNHQVVVEALGLLAAEGKHIQILCTGNPADYRHPEYFKLLMARVDELHVASAFSHLGIIPATDLGALMRDAWAILNPSFFEGWSTTVEEAKAIGKRIILSDIPVHREQEPERGSYFLPEDAEALASLLWQIWNEQAHDEFDFSEQARQNTNKRRMAFASKYQEIVLSTIENCK